MLYFHDGQNLFNPEWVYYTQTDWGIDETLQRLIDTGEVDDTIVSRHLEHAGSDGRVHAVGPLPGYVG